MHKKSHKLTLKRETLRDLVARNMGLMAGGATFGASCIGPETGCASCHETCGRTCWCSLEIC